MQKDKFEYKILLIEDNPGDILLIEDYLHEHMLNPKISIANRYEEAQEILIKEAHNFNIILLDLSLPDKQGEDLITNILEISNGTPVVILTGYTDVDFSIKSLELGVSDYLLKEALNPFALYKSVLHNIARKQFIQVIQHSEKRYNDLFHFSPQPMMVLDQDSFRILDVNNSAIKVYDLSLKDFQQLTILDLSPDETRDEVKNIFQQLNGNFTGYLGDFIHKRNKKENIDVEIHLNPISFSGKEAFILQANNISDRLKYIQAIEDQNKRLNKISWVQSHVVRAPLVRMMGLIDLLQTEQDLTVEQEKFYFGNIMETAEELDSIIRDISNKAKTIDYIKNQDCERDFNYR